MGRTARPWLRAALVALGLVALAAGWVALRDLPKLAPGTASATGEPPRLRGVYHVHSDSSHDGRVSATELMAAADRLGLDFVVFTEHNTRPVHASSPGGALAVPGTELSTRFGHLVYLGYPEVPEPGPLRQDSGLVDSLNVRGAFTILAHPASPRRPWTGRRAAAAGLEIASTSSSARVKADPFIGLLAALFALPFNPPLALAQLYRRNSAALEIWDGVEGARMIGFCSADVHGWLGGELDLRSWHLVLDPWPTAGAEPTADEIVERLSAGRFVCQAGLLAPATDPPPRFSFRAETPDGVVPQGRSVTRDSVRALVVEAPELRGGGEVTTVLLRDGVEMERTTNSVLRVRELSPGTYRAEVRVEIPGVFYGSRPVPAIYSNRIRVTR